MDRLDPPEELLKRRIWSSQQLWCAITRSSLPLADRGVCGWSRGGGGCVDHCRRKSVPLPSTLGQQMDVHIVEARDPENREMDWRKRADPQALGHRVGR